VEIPTAPTGGDAGRPDDNGGGRGSAAPATRAALAPREVVDAQATPPPPSSPLPHAAGRFDAATDALAALAAVSRRPPPLRPHTAGGPPLFRPAFPIITDRAPAAAIDVCTGRRRSGQSASGSRGGTPTDRRLSSSPRAGRCARAAARPPRPGSVSQPPARADVTADAGGHDSVA